MSKLLGKIKLVDKLIAFTILLILLCCGSIGFLVAQNLDQSLQKQVIENQNKNIKVAASIFERDMDNFRVNYASDDKFRLELSDFPAFKDHHVIDMIGTITGETATLFLWDEKTQDYWRKTTNIIKDGSRSL